MTVPSALAAGDPAPEGNAVGDVSVGDRYDVGTAALTDIWVDPVNGDDGHTGATRDQALRSIAAAWNQIPQSATLTNGVRIALTAGEYAAEDAPNYWESHWGTAVAPIVVESVDGPGAAHLPSMNVFEARYLYVLGISITSEFDPFHCEQCDHLLLRGVTLSGVGDIEVGAGPQETLKINQSTNVYVEDSDLSGATDNALDMVAVQYGRIVGNRIHRAVDWCAYTKGGAAYLLVSGNEFFDCGTGGFTAGQGTGFQFMTSPWINYEAYGVQVLNNVVHDVEGAAFGAAGGYDVVFAHNTAFRVGSRSQLVDVVLGRRGCDGAPDNADAVSHCQALHDAGGWGPIGEEQEIIPNRDVWFFDNLLINDAGHESGTQLLQVHGCRSVNTDATAVPSPTCATDGLRFVGNVLVDGAGAHPIAGDGSGCADSGSPCEESMLRRDNRINDVTVRLADVAGGDYCVASIEPPVAGVPVPDWTWDGHPAGPGTPEVPAPPRLSIDVSHDRHGAPRTAGSPPGAC